MSMALIIIFAAGIGFARETQKRQTKGPRIAPGISGTNRGAIENREENIGIDDDAPMKIAVDRFMQIKNANERANEEAKGRTEEDTASPASFQEGVTTKNSISVVQSSVDKQAEAQAVLQSLIEKDPILEGSIVVVKECPHNWQGCAYYESGTIWIDPDHTAPLEKIMVHECNHITDWRSDGDIDYNDYHE